MSESTRFSIVLPCFNEAESIPLLLERSKSLAQSQEVNLVLVDNGSTDDSARVIAELLPSYPFVRSVRVPVNQGYGFGILEGLRSCQSEFIGWTHADLQTDPNDILRAVEIFQVAGYPRDLYVKGQRRGRPVSDSFFTGAMAVFESLYLGVRLWDINAQPNLFHRSFFESWKSPPHDFALDLYALYAARKEDLRVTRFEVQFPERTYGHSKWNTGFQSKVKFIARTLDYSVKLKRKLSETRS